MRKQKTKARTSWTSKYNDERQRRKDLLEAQGVILDTIPERPWEDVSYDKYAQQRIDSEILNQVPSSLREQEELYLNEFKQQEEERYAKYRKDREDAINEFAEKHSWAPKYNNIPLLDKVLDVYDFFTDQKPAEKQGYSASVLNTALVSPGLAVSGIVKNFDWAKDVWNYFGRNMNDLQIEDYQGYIDRANVFNHLVESEKQAVAIELDIEDIDDTIRQMSVINTSDQQKTAIISQLNLQKTLLQNRLANLDEDRKALRSYEPGLSSKILNTAANWFFPFKVISNNPVFGKTTEVRDELVDITRGLSDYNPNASYSDRLKQLNNIQSVYTDKLKEWNDGIEENLRDKESYGKVSIFFQHEADSRQIEFFNPYTYLVAMPGLMAGSMSTLNKQLPAMITGYASGAAFSAAALTGDHGALAGGIGGTLGTYYLNHAAGISESNSEVAFELTDKIRNALINKGLYKSLIDEGRRKLKDSDDLSDDEIFDRFRRGLFTTDNSVINKELFKQSVGIENAFNDEMAAVTWDAAIDTALEVIPLGGGLKVLKTPFGRPVKNFIRSNKYWRQAITSEPAKKFIRSNLGQRIFEDASAGFRRGATVSPIMAAANVPLHIALAPTERYVGNLVMGQVANKLGWTAKVLSTIPEQTLGKALIGSTRAKYMYDAFGRLITVAASEGIEEGKQGHIQKRFGEGYYDSNVIRSIWDVALDDFIAGSRSGALILGMPFESMFSEEDKKILNEIKGGMLMGMFGHSTVINVLSNAAPYIREQNANQFIVELFLDKKFDDIKRFNKAALYAEKAKDGSAYSSVLQAFDRLANENDKYASRTGTAAVDPQAINDEIAEFKKVVQEANNLYTIKSARQQGILPGTLEYNLFVAAKTLALHHVEDEQDAVNEAKDALDKAQTDIRAKYLEQAFNQAQTAMPGNHEQQSVPQQPVSNNFGYSYTDTLAQYTALLKRKQEIEVGILNAENRNNQNTKTILQKQLDSVNGQIAFSRALLENMVNDKQALDTVDNIEKSLVYDKESYDVLVPLWREFLLRTDDLNLAVSELNDITGKLQIKDGEDWRDLTNDDYADPEAENNEGKFDPAKDIDKVKYVDGKAKEIIRQYLGMVLSDNELQENLQEVHSEQVDATILAVEEGAVDTKGNVIDETKLNNVEQQIPEQPDPQELFRQEVEQKPKLQINQSTVSETSGNGLTSEQQDKNTESTPKQNIQEPQRTPRNGEVWDAKYDNEVTLDDIWKVWEEIGSPRNSEEKEWQETQYKYHSDGTPVKPNEVPRNSKGQIVVLGPSSEGFTTEAIYSRAKAKKQSVRPELPIVQQPEPLHEQEELEKKPSVENTRQSKSKYVDEEDQEKFAKLKAEMRRVLLGQLNAGIDPEILRIGTQMSYLVIKHGAHKFVDYAKAMIEELGEAIRPHLKMLYSATRYMDGVDPEVVSKMDDDSVVRTTDINTIDKDKTIQLEVVEKIKLKVQESQSYVIDVTPDYYLIKVGNEKVKMPRVHSIMPKYWVDDKDSEHKNNNAYVQASLQVGGAFDTLARIFFSNKSYWNRFGNQETRQSVIDELFNTDAELFKKKNDKKLNKTFAELYSDRESFAKTLLDLYNLAIQYDKLGWELVSDPIVWFNKFNIGYVAGETDMIAVDKSGNIHIIDFKTAKGNVPFERFLWARPELTLQYKDLLSTLTELDFAQGKRRQGLSKKAIAIKKQINKRENTDSIILVWNSFEKVAEVQYVNSNFYSTNGSLFRLGPKSEEYSDQLTAYADMIQSQLFNVVDLEIVGFKTSYSINFEKVGVETIENLTNNVNGKPFRIHLSFSDKMRGILNNEGNVDQLVETTTPRQEAKEEKEIILSTETQLLRVQDNNNPPIDLTTLSKPDEPKLDPVRAKHKDQNGSFDHTDLDYVRISKDKLFTDDTNAYDFITWLIENGAVELYTEVVKGERFLYANINYKGHEYKRVYIQTHVRVNGKNKLTEAGEYLMKQVMDLEGKKKPGQKIVAIKMNRTAGSIGKRKGGDVVPMLDSDLLAETNLSDLEMTSTDGRFGFVKNGDIISFENGNPNQQTVIYSFRGRNIPVPKNGSIVFIKSTNHKERKTLQQIPVTLTKASLVEDFDFIIDCLRNIDQLDKPYVFTQNGETIRIEATRRQLLSLLIPYVDDINNTDNILSIVRDRTNPSTFYITSKNRTSPAASVNVLIPESVERFKQQLANLSVTETPEMLTARLGDTKLSSLLVFSNIRKFFANKNNKIKSITISKNLKFDFDDFKLIDSTKTSNLKNEGLSGLGWAIKTGWFRTDYGGMLATNVEIEEAGLVEDKPIDVSTPASVEETASVINTDPDSILDQLTGFVLKKEGESDINKPKLTERQIRENLRPILGDLVDDPNLFKIITSVPYDPQNPTAKIVGKASSDAITIYNAAFAGVEYHEAFHRIFELYVPEKIRELVYKNVARKLGIDLSKSTKETKYYGHRLVAERVADDYMDIKNGEKKVSKYNFVNKAYNIIRDIIRIFKHLDNKTLYILYLLADLGAFKHSRVSDSSKQRFDEIFGELNYEIHGYEFDHILNDAMYEDVKDSMFYLLTLGQKIDLSGSNVNEIQITKDVIKAGADKLRNFGFDIFGKEGSRTAGLEAMNEAYEKFYAISDDLAARFSQIATDYVKKFEEEEREKMDGDEESIKSANYEEQIRASYEFSRFDKTSSRVKFFFSLLPQMQYTSEGKLRFITNSLGMPTLIPMNYVFNEVLTSLWDVDTLDELENRLADLAKGNTMFLMIYNNIKKVIAGRVVNGKVDNDKESLLTQLFTTIKSNRHTFMIARSERVGEKYDIVLETSDSEYNAKFYPMQWGQILAKGGTEVLKVDSYGRLVFNPKNKYASQLFTRIADFFDSIKTVNGVHEVGLKQMLSPAAFTDESTYRMTVKVIDQDKTTGDKIVRKSIQLTDLRKPDQCSIVKDKIVEALNSIGVRVTSDEFDFMLRHKYGSSDWEALRQMVTSTSDKDSMGSFLLFLRNIVHNDTLNIDQEGNVLGMRNKRTPVTLELAYSQMAFIKELGNWKWTYRHAHDLLSVLAIDGNRFYEMSDNDYISDVLRGLNKRDKQFEELKLDPYNYHIGEEDALGQRTVTGSIVLKLLTENPEQKLLLRHFIGFKTDKKGDLGSDYFEITRREDYLSKATILENGGIIMLTLSDKKKYVYVDGVKLPGFDYSSLSSNDAKVREESMRKLAENIIIKPGIGSSKHQVLLNIDVINLMISYALSEYASVKKAGLKINELEKAGLLQQDVVNFYTLHQGARFSSLLGVWENKYDKNGNIVGEQFISFNKSNKSWEKNLKTAEEHFFNKPEEEQQALIARNLQHILDKELNTATELGIIEKFPSENPYLGYRNVGLNNSIISSIRNAYKTKYPAISDGDAESLAVVMYLSDMSAKAIMSGQEVERLFSGNPAFYKWKYDKQGNLIDRTTDELKRLGGLGSTGTNNFLELENIPEKYIKDGKFTGKYIQAEVDNEMVSSPQIDEIRTIVYENLLKYNAYVYKETLELLKLEGEHNRNVTDIRKAYKTDKNEMTAALLDEDREYKRRIADTKKQIADYIYESSVQQIEKEYENIVELSKIRANEVAEAYAGEIDVADGGAYITDEMCEMLLRMVGSYTNEVEKAFDILRGRVKADYLKQANAYNTVLTTVIGSQKYTAFGRRMQNGVSVPYYNKMALFPLFDCIATGRMRNILEKMRQQKIDVLAVNSAVKVGSQGSKPIEWSKFRVDNDPTNEYNFVDGDLGSQNWKPVFEDAFSFNTYEQDFSALRKQLNTDPTEEKLMRAGTQMQKVVFSNMIEGKTYIGQDGSKQTGLDLRNRIMGAMNALSNIGLDKLNQRFFKTNEDGKLVNINGEEISRNSTERVLDIKKFVAEVSKMMSDRGADKNIMNALEYIQSQNADYVPLGAISNSNWIESVLISIINKEVIDVNTPGAFFIQRSVWGMEGQKMVDRSNGKIIGATIYDGKELMMKNSKNSMDCVLSLDFFEHILPQIPVKDDDGRIVYQVNEDGSFKLNKDGNRIPVMRKMSFEEARKWLLDHNIIGENANANIVGYRIPTQAESSIHALRCVDVLPVVRDTVILPKEFTKITGSDFDIDKLGLSWLNYNKQGTTEFEYGSPEYYLNQILESFLTLLVDKDTLHILHRSIDNDTRLLKDIITELQTKNEQTEEPYSFYALSTQTERKNDYITGKIGIGPFALNNNNHILTMLYGVKFKKIDGSIMTELGLTDLSRREDFEHNSILSWISALINAHVDIAKDPYISKLNVNPFTYNLVNTLIRTGFGKNTFYFTTQPIMKLLARAYMNAQSSYMADPNKTQYQLLKEAVQEVAKTLFKNEELPFLSGMKLEDIENVVAGGNPFVMANVSEAFKSIVDNENLRENANVEYSKVRGTTVKVADKEYELTPNQVQYIIYLAYLQMDPYAKSVSSLVKYSKIDTKKQGNNYIEQQLYLQGFNDLFYSNEAGGLFEDAPLKDIADNSYIATKTRNAIAITKSILSGQFLQSTDGFDNARMVVLNKIGRGGSKDLALNNKIVQILMAAIKSEFINSYARTLEPNNPTYIRDLVNESFEQGIGYQMEQGSTEMKLSNDMKYKPSSYIGGRVVFNINAAKNDNLKVGMILLNGGYIYNIIPINDSTSEYQFSYPIVGANDDNNSIIVPFKRDNSSTEGTIIKMTGGKNTMYDRFNRLIIELSDNPDYLDVLDSAGNPVNMLLRSLVPGKTYQYKEPQIRPTVFTESPDTYDNLKFIKLFNALDNNGVESNYIIDAWDLLLHDTRHPALKKFAEDLIVYAFVTSGDKGGFTKFFKLVPLSWRKESGYGRYIQDKINDLTVGDLEEETIDDAILNNWFDNDIVRTYYAKDKNKVPQFIMYNGTYRASNEGFVDTMSFPLIAAALRNNEKGMLEPSIDPNDAPLYIKIPRRMDDLARESQRKYTVFKLQGIAMTKNSEGPWIEYPVYVKINPKGMELKGGYLMTEYGRNDSVNPERTTDTEKLEAIYKVSEFISRQDIERYKFNFSAAYSDVVENLNYSYVLDKLGGDRQKFEQMLVRLLNTEPVEQQTEQGVTRKESVWVRANGNYTRQSVQNDPNTLYIFTDNTDRTSGGKPYGDGWYKEKYGEGGYGSDSNPTTAQIRGLDNAAPISTMRYFYRLHKGMTVADARWNDSNLEEFKAVIDSEIEDIKKLWDSGRFNKIVSPAGDGFFNSRIAQIRKDSEIGKYLLKKLQELYDYVNNNQRQLAQLNSNTTINIYAGTNENADLSNFAERPVLLDSPYNFGFVQFRTVEGAFQAAKLKYADIDGHTYLDFESRLASATGAEARRIGRLIPKLDTLKWNTNSSRIMKEIILKSFLQNPQALQRLLATGNATLTHTQDNSRWKTEFPRILMEVRDELRGLQNNSEDPTEMTEEERKEAKKYKKMCEGE